MPSQVQIISPRNSREWRKLIDNWAMKLREQHTYGGIGTEERANEVRAKLAYTAKRTGKLGRRVFYKPCGKPAGQCEFGDDCRYHVYCTLYPIEDARAYKQQHPEKVR